MTNSEQDYRELLCKELAEAAKLMRLGAARKNAAAIHDARIALRRSREYLELVTFTHSERKLIRAELKKCMQGTSKAREFDSYLDHLKRLDIAGTSRVVKILKKAREDAYRDLKHVVSRLSLIAESSAIVAETLPPAGKGAGGAMLKKEFKRLSRSIYPKLVRIAGRKDATKIHKFRIALKQLRYVAEVAAHTKRDGRRLKSLRKVQHILGDLRDVHLLRKLLKRGELGGSEEQIVGLLKSDEKELFQKFKKITDGRKFRLSYSA